MIANYQADAPVNQQYQLIKLAWNNYQKAPEALESAQLDVVAKQATVASRLMTAVLASAEAQSEQIKAEEVEFIFVQLKEQFADQASFELSLEQQELTVESLKQAIYQDLLCEKTIATQSCNYPQVTEQEAVDYYLHNKQKFKHPERRKVSHILITVNDQYAENRRSQAEKRINGVRKQLVKNLDKFAQMAAKYSECPTSLNEGLVGVVSRGQLYPQLDTVLFNMLPQTISSVVESEIGLHLLLCHEIIPAGETKQADAVKAITKQLNEHRKKKCEKQWLSQLLQVKQEA